MRRGLRFQLPPMNAIVAFEAVSRHMSVTRAAEELSVSREAVSRHIRVLESYLGARLFVRLQKSLELTPAGREFSESVKRSLDLLSEATGKFRTQEGRRRLSIITTTAISYCWLTPRLDKFSKLHPNIDLHISASDQSLDVKAKKIDVGILYGDGSWIEMNSTPLSKGSIFAVCSPKYLAKHGKPSTPKDITKHRLLVHDGEQRLLRNWSWWFSEAGISDHGKLSILGFDSYADVMQAAIAGQGIALGYVPIINDFLSRRELVKAADFVARSATPRYYLVYPVLTPISEEAKLFGNWVLREARELTKNSGAPRR